MLSSLDKKNIWHPYTQEKTAGESIVITKGKGAYLYDENGTKYIDAIASWWTNIHGHAHPYIAQKIAAQANQLEQVIFAAFSHPSAILLAEKLLQFLPDFQKIFYSDNGSTAVEAAIKMTLQYWGNLKTPKQKIICFKDAYHGDTFGAMSVSSRGVFTAPFQQHLFEVLFIDTPNFDNEEQILSQFESVIQQYKDDIAAFIFEPLVLGSAGMLMYSPALLDELLFICQKNNILTIADEVMTGFGRTGKMFAIDYLQVKPDIITLSKGITGGFLPFAATLVTDKIYNAFLHDERSKMLFHGHSYTGNPLGCAAAIASLEVFEMEDTMLKVSLISMLNCNFVQKNKLHRAIERIESSGTILAIAIKTNETTGYLNTNRESIIDFFNTKNIIIRPLGNVLYLLPPYCISVEDLNYIYQTIEDFLATI